MRELFGVMSEGRKLEMLMEGLLRRAWRLSITIRCPIIVSEGAERIEELISYLW